MKKMPFVFVLLVFAFLLSSCDLFNRLPVDDLEARMEEQVRWARAERLTVRLEFPSSWGTSNPGQGTITTTMDIRKGFPFTLEFTPDMPYHLYTWKAFCTSRLNYIVENSSVDIWQDDPMVILDAMGASIG